jgi:hypothetical protein
VKFREFVRDIQARAKKTSIDRKTRKRLRSYRNSGELKFPRLYGYRKTPNGTVVVENEARTIQLVLQLLSDGKSVKEIKRKLDEMNLRGRSGNPFTEREIIQMPKPVYAGMIRTRSGRWVKSAYYQPIVPVETLKNARKAVKRLSEGLDFAFPAVDGRVFLTLAG